MTGYLEGSVSHNNYPIEGATVKAIRTDGEEVLYSTTDSNGEFSIEATDGEEYHVVSRYTDGIEVYSDYLKPFVMAAGQFDGDILVLEGVDSVSDLPDIESVDTADIYHIRTGDLATDYVIPVHTDGTEVFDEWHSLVDGQVLYDIPDSLTNRWPVDEGSGSTLADNEGSIDATLESGSWTADSNAIGGYNISLDGSADYISLPSDSALEPGSEDYTWGFVIEQNQVSDREVIFWAHGEGGGTPQVFARFEESDNQILFRNHDGSNTVDVTASGLFDDGERHFFAFRRDGADFDIWIDDGVSSSESDSSIGDISSGSNGVAVGRQVDSSDQHRDGQQDEFCYAHETALTDSELSDLASRYGVA